MKSRTVESDVHDLPTTGEVVRILYANMTGYLSELELLNREPLPAHGVNYVEWSIVNTGQDGEKSVDMLASGPANSTQARGGAELERNGRRRFALSDDPAALQIQAGDEIRITAKIHGNLLYPIDNCKYSFTVTREA